MDSATITKGAAPLDLVLLAINGLKNYQNHLRSRGLNVFATHNNFLHLKRNVPIERIKLIINHLEVMNTCYSAMEKNKDTSEMSLLLYFLKEAHLPIPDKTQTSIKEDDVVEVYDRENIQIFRNSHFFRICTYSIEDILTHEWWNLYERNVFLTQRIANTCVDIFSNNLQEPKELNLYDYDVREKWSPGLSSLRINQKVLVPIFDTPTKKTIGFINALEVLEQKFLRENFTLEQADKFAEIASQPAEL